MRTRLWRIVSLLTLLALLASPFYLGSSTAAAGLEQEIVPQKPGMRIVKSSLVAQSQPLRSLAPRQVDPDARSVLKTLQDRLVIPKSVQGSGGGSDDSVVQHENLGLSMPAPIANFEGVGNIDGVLPPDTQGDIGYDPLTDKKYYIQWVNLSFQIWDVTDPALPVSVYGPAAGNTLWSGTSTLCDLNNDGDPITLFDPLAKRWLMSQFALGFPNNFHQCIAVSATADPTGVWYLYDFLTSTTMMNDYPKFGVWPDGYYMTVNQFDGNSFAWGGAGAAVFQRQAMLNGQPAMMVYFDIGEQTLDYGGMLPSDLDGTAPAVGAPNYFMEWDDSTWLDDPQDTLRIWEFHADWSNPANTTFGLNASYDPNFMVATSNQDPNLCNMDRDCIPQPDTVVGLDAISDRLMYRLQYRNFGEYETLLTNHTVGVGGADWAGVHWFELRKTGSSWALFQEGVYAPDADHRWMGSIAMDDSGNIGLGYSVSSSTTYPSIRYTGRLAADPVNQMPQGETSLIAGGGSQTHTASRWGDYSMMAVDPVDGCTFWYTQEYIAATGSAPWKTRIGSFKFPSCTALPTGTLTGMVTDGSSPLVGAAVTAAGGYSTVTNASGVYTLVLPVGDYDVTASMFGFEDETVTGLVITEDLVTTQDFVLSPATFYTVSGVVSDSTTGWPLYASIDIFGYPYNPIFSDPVTGEYSVDLVAGSYNFNVNALSGGYNTGTAFLTVASALTQDFGLDADLIACTAPGYVPKPATFSEGFETWPPAGWTVVDNIAGGGVPWDSSDNYSEANYTGGTGLAAEANSDMNLGVNYDTELISPVITAASMPNLYLTYKANFQIYSGHERLDLDITSDSGSGWTNLIRWQESHGSLFAANGETVFIDLAPEAGETFQLRWHYYTPETQPWDYYAQIDEVALGASCDPIPAGGLVVGSVFDNNTDLPIANASVTDGALNQAVWIDTAADPNQSAPLYVTGVGSGAAMLTASAYRYASKTESPAVVPGDTVRHDFYLDAGQLSLDPTHLSLTTIFPKTLVTDTLSLSNTGAAAAEYEVFPILGTWVGYAPTGPFAANTRHTGPKNLMDRDAANLRVITTPLNVTQLDAGIVSASWSTGLVSPWGIGYNLDVDDLWVGNIAAGGGDDLNYRFETDGTITSDTIDTSPWVSIFAADMTYNPFTHKLWQLNVGENNCIHEMDPDTLSSTGTTICPAFGTSQRGLAYDPLSNTYYSGSWNDSVINHFAPDGTLLDSANVGLPISGLAFNPASGHLFVMTNREILPDTNDVYVLDAHDSYALLGGFDLLNGATNAFTSYAQAGLEIDCSGNLWAVDQTLSKVYVADSGETGVCDWQTNWLSAMLAAGTVPAAGSTAVTVFADAQGMEPGLYEAYLRLVSNTPYSDIIVPVELTVPLLQFMPFTMK